MCVCIYMYVDIYICIHTHKHTHACAPACLVKLGDIFVTFPKLCIFFIF